MFMQCTNIILCLKEIVIKVVPFFLVLSLSFYPALSLSVSVSLSVSLSLSLSVCLSQAQRC